MVVILFEVFGNRQGRGKSMKRLLFQVVLEDGSREIRDVVEVAVFVDRSNPNLLKTINTGILQACVTGRGVVGVNRLAGFYHEMDGEPVDCRVWIRIDDGSE